MEELDKFPTKVSSYSQSGFLSKLYFTWVIKYVWRGFRGRRNEAHVPESLKSDIIGLHLSRKWDEEVHKVKPSLLKVLLKQFGGLCSVISLIFFLKYCIAALIQIYCLGILVGSYDDSEADTYFYQQYLSASIIIIVNLITLPCQAQCQFMSAVTGMKISAACSSLVFQKILRISTAEIQHLNIGHLINIIANDLAKLDHVCREVLRCFSNPLLVVAFIVYLNFEVGIAVWASIAVISIFLLVNLLLGKFFKTFKKQKMLATDQRIKFTTEMISEVKAVKMLSWEDAYYRIINKFRNMECKSLMKIFMLRTIFTVQLAISPNVILFVLLVVMVLIGDDITPKKVFISMSSFAAFTMVLVYMMGSAFENAAYGLVILERITNLLKVEEMKQNVKKEMNENNKLILNFESSWISSASTDKRQDCETFLLKINTSIPRGSMTVVSGPVGSGKSCFLLSIANELCVLGGDVSIEGRIAYLPQQSWLFATTIKQNILFGLPLDEERYRKVVWACSIDKDLTCFEKGDETFVDDKGLTLSGGQKARICLARCLYRDCDIYLLDDPLSAVDTRVENHIYRNCFLDFISHKTIILVSHRLKNLADDVNFISMEKGQILSHGQYGENKFKSMLTNELVKTKVAIDVLADDIFDFDKHSSTSTKKIKLSEDALEMYTNKKQNPLLLYSQMAINSFHGFGAMLPMVFLGFAALASSSFFDISITIWTNEMYEKESSNRNMAKQLYFLGFVILIQIALYGITYGSLLYLCMRATRNMHRNMLKRVLKAQMKFFDSNKTGEIINNFTKDMENVDEILPELLSRTLMSSLYNLVLLINVAYSNYIVIGPVFISIILLISIIIIYSKVINTTRHMEADSRSPMYTYLNTTINGLAVIRSHENQARVSQEFNWHQDQHSASWFLLHALVESISLLGDIISTIIIISIVVISFTAPLGMTGSKLGLAISSSMSFGELSQYAVNIIMKTGNQLFSVTRIQSYAELPLEDEIFTSNCNPMIPTNWPCEGSIVFNNVQLDYGSTKVLKLISFNINPGEKIGIIGRTGAGKSSIVTALFRMASFSGSITVDGVDIHSLPLYEYRKKLSVIPQNPVILAGTIRYNLDPSNEHSDEQLWSVLESVCLKSCIENLAGGLNTKMDHLSVGEKQLCCLARVILRNSKIVVLDEATSNIDNNLDQQLQLIVKKRFQLSTMLIIAHRLETIMDTDRVMLLQQGEILEFDKPSTLLQNPESFFYRMVHQTAYQNIAT